MNTVCLRIIARLKSLLMQNQTHRLACVKIESPYDCILIWSPKMCQPVVAQRLGLRKCPPPHHTHVHTEMIVTVASLWFVILFTTGARRIQAFPRGVKGACTSHGSKVKNSQIGFLVKSASFWQFSIMHSAPRNSTPVAWNPAYPSVHVLYVRSRVNSAQNQLGPNQVGPKPTRPKTKSAQNQLGPKPTRPKIHRPWITRSFSSLLLLLLLPLFFSFLFSFSSSSFFFFHHLYYHWEFISLKGVSIQKNWKSVAL